MMSLANPAAALSRWAEIRALAPLNAAGLVTAIEHHQARIAEAMSGVDALNAEIGTVTAERDVWRAAYPKPPAPTPDVMLSTVAAHELRLANLAGAIRTKQGEIVKLTGERDAFLAQLTRLIPGLEGLAVAAPVPAAAPAAVKSAPAARSYSPPPASLRQYRW
jgi:hypothetical protein